MAGLGRVATAVARAVVVGVTLALWWARRTDDDPEWVACRFIYGEDGHAVA